MVTDNIVIKTTTMDGYFGVSNVSLKSIIVQETLMYLKHYGLRNWRCLIVSYHPCGNPFVQVDRVHNMVRLFPNLLKLKYEDATARLHEELDEQIIQRGILIDTDDDEDDFSVFFSSEGDSERTTVVPPSFDIIGLSCNGEQTRTN